MKNIDQIIKKFNPKQNLLPEFELLSGDASSRMYYRYHGEEKNYILTLYPEENMKASLERYMYWQKKYSLMQLPVPELYAVDYQRQIVVQADLGNWMLQKELGNSTIENEKSRLHQAIELLSKIRKIDGQDYNGKIPSFDFEKLNFEVSHTLKYFVSIYMQKDSRVVEFSKLWEPLLRRISNLPMVMCHRDYHSRNLMFLRDKSPRENPLIIIDFQDTMYGPIHYDLCSLLDDCYLKYHPSSYQNVLRNFFDQALSDKLVSASFEDFFVNYHLVKLQRQFKAIGSFCYVWSEKNNVKYLKYIAYVMESIKHSFNVLDLPELAALKEKTLTLYYEH